MAAYSREESLKRAAEKLRKQREEEKRKDDAYYQKITSGTPWLLFKIVVAFCTLMVVLTSIDVFADGPTENLTENDWKIDRQLYMTGHQSIRVDGALFVAPFAEWMGHVDDSFALTKSLIFRTGKKLSYDQEISEGVKKRHEVIRRRSIFTWFPYLQIMMLIPLATFIFKRQTPLFNFARAGSFLIVLPGTLLVLFMALL